MITAIIFLLVSIIVYIVGFCMGCSWIFKRNYEFTMEQCKCRDKFWKMFLVTNCWLDIWENEKKIVHYFEKMNYSNVAVYGIGYLGKHLVKELAKSEIKIDYIIDKNAKESIENITMYRPNETLPDTAVIVVTAIMDFNEIVDILDSKVGCPIVSIEDIIRQFPAFE